MITSARIDALRELNDDPDTATDFGWITALRAPAIAKLAARRRAAADEPVRRPGPGRDRPPRLPRGTVDRLPQPRAGGRARPQTRASCWPRPTKLLAAVADRVTRGTLAGAGEIGKAVGKVIDKYKMGKHFHTTITDTTLAYRRDPAGIDAEAELDGIYVLRTSVDADTLDPAAVVRKLQEPGQRRTRLPHHQDRRPGPATHPPPPRGPRQSPRADLPARLLPHLAPTQGLGTNDIHRRTPTPTRQPGRARTALHRQADAKASRKHDADGNPLRSFGGLLDHLATLTRNQIRYHGASIEVPVLADPTPDQRRAFDLLDTPIPLTAAA